MPCAALSRVRRRVPPRRLHPRARVLPEARIRLSTDSRLNNQDCWPAKPTPNPTLLLKAKQTAHYYKFLLDELIRLRRYFSNPSVRDLRAESGHAERGS